MILKSAIFGTIARNAVTTNLVYIVLVMVLALIVVAFLTLFERNVIGTLQRRLGPNVVWIYGSGQALADAVKLIVKELVLPSVSNSVLFALAPWVTLWFSLLIWIVLPFGENQILCDLDLGIVFLYAVSSLGAYGILLSGWASNSKYAWFGAVRSVSQMISYEVSMGIIYWNILMITNSLSLVNIVLQQQNQSNMIGLPLLFILFLISCLAETSRVPFDLAEAETELIAGFHVELAGIGFTLFFLAEYANIVAVALLTTTLFVGGWCDSESACTEAAPDQALPNQNRTCEKQFCSLTSYQRAIHDTK